MLTFTLILIVTLSVFIVAFNLRVVRNPRKEWERKHGGEVHGGEPAAEALARIQRNATLAMIFGPIAVTIMGVVGYLKLEQEKANRALVRQPSEQQSPMFRDGKVVRSGRIGPFGGPGDFLSPPVIGDKRADNRITIGGRDYALRFFHNTVVGRVEKRGPFCLSKDGTTWVIDPLRPDLKDHFPLPWPVETLSADRSLALVRVPAKKDQLAVADVRTKTLVAEFPSKEEAEFFNVNPGEWVFCKERQRVYPLSGIGLGGWHYLDLAQKKRVVVEAPGFRPRDGVHIWNGALLHGGQEIVLFLTGGSKTDGRRRMQFPIADLDKRSVAVADIDVIWVLDSAKDQLTAYLGAGKYGTVSTQTWKVIKHFDWPEQVRSPLLQQVGPGGRHAYLINDLHRLVVYEPKTGKLVKVLLDSQEIEARALAVTFTADGRHGAVAAHGSHIAVFNTDRHEIVHQFAVKRTPSMAFLIEPAKNEATGILLVVD